MMTNQHKSLIVEIIGPAGSGKTTLYNALGRMPGIQSESLPPVWKISHLAFFTRNILSLTPLLLRSQVKGDRKITRRELAWMAMLNGWQTILERKRRQEGNIILLDQGPIFLMAALKGFGPQCIKQKSWQGWWNKIYTQWARTLDLVVWLDAADGTLRERIQGRESDHLVKGRSEQEVHEFLENYRAIYEKVVSEITSHHQGTRVIRIDTGQHPVDEVIRIVTSDMDYRKEDLRQA